MTSAKTAAMTKVTTTTTAMQLPRVSIQTADFDLAAEVAALRARDGGVGAVVSFVGTVRDRAGAVPNGSAPITALELEHYPGMTEASIEAMIDQAIARFDIRAARVVHRVGPLLPLDQIVLVAVTSAHRGQAFQACEFLMDYLKTQAPFWKKESTTAGAVWVDARVSDDDALRRWGIQADNAGPGSKTPG
jgi:molybdopterin synthase catalytic subunit